MQTARTTIELDKELLKKAKQKALEEEKTLKQLFGDFVREGLEKTPQKAKKARPKFRFKAYDMGTIKLPLTREQIYEDI